MIERNACFLFPSTFLFCKAAKWPVILSFHLNSWWLRYWGAYAFNSDLADAAWTQVVSCWKQIVLWWWSMVALYLFWMRVSALFLSRFTRLIPLFSFTSDLCCSQWSVWFCWTWCSIFLRWCCHSQSFQPDPGLALSWLPLHCSPFLDD